MVVAATVLAARRRLQLAAGLLIASGVAGSAKYLGLLGRVITAKGDPVRLDSVLVFCLVPAAAFALIPIGMRLAQLAGIRLGGESGPERFPLAASGFLVLAGCLVPFNRGGTKPEQFERAILPNEGTQALDPLVVGLALLGLALIMRYLPRALAGGLCSLSDWRA